MNQDNTNVKKITTEENKESNSRQTNNNLLEQNLLQGQIIPETLKNTVYTPAFLRKHIGRLVKVEFLIGTTYLEDRTGILLEVGASYIVLRSVQDNNLLYCDIYSIKFVTISTQSFIYGMDYPYSQNMNQGYNQMNNINSNSFNPGSVNSSSFM